jgi:hypothetical protein
VVLVAGEGCWSGPQGTPECPGKPYPQPQTSWSLTLSSAAVSLELRSSMMATQDQSQQSGKLLSEYKVNTQNKLRSTFRALCRSAGLITNSAGSAASWMMSRILRPSQLSVLLRTTSRHPRGSYVIRHHHSRTLLWMNGELCSHHHRHHRRRPFRLPLAT